MLLRQNDEFAEWLEGRIAGSLTEMFARHSVEFAKWTAADVGHGGRARSMTTASPLPAPIVQAIEEKRRARRMTIERLSVRSGVPIGTIKGWLYRGQSPRLADATDCLAALGFELGISIVQTKQWVLP